MKIQYLSDLHLETCPFEYEDCGADVVILAGDIHIGKRGVEWALEMIKDRPVIYVLGNHEYYKNSYPELSIELKTISKETNAHVLERDAITIDGVRFLGCSLWTDFRLFANPESAKELAGSCMYDYQQIKVVEQMRKLTPDDTALDFLMCKNWLEYELKKQSNVKTVVVTHHGPSIGSVAKRYLDNELTPAFVSNLESLIMEYEPRFWVHGHVHNTANYRIGNTTVLTNPRGYSSENAEEFDPRRIFQI